MSSDVGAGLGGTLDRRRRHRRRRQPHVAPDRDPPRLELLDVGAPDRVGALLVELGRVDPAHVVGLEHLRIEHRPDAMEPACDGRPPPRVVSTLVSVERKLATVLFVDLVGSTALVASADPEVVRRRVTRFFDEVSTLASTRTAAIVEKFAGDAVLAAFGVPQAHEDDAERAIKAAFAILDQVRELGLEARVGIESGEVVVDERRVDVRHRRGRQRRRPAAAAGGLGRGADRPGRARPLLRRDRRGGARPGRPARASATRSRSGERSVPATLGRAVVARRAPLIGRESELDLLANTFGRTVRDRRAHLFTIYGEAGVGKSRLAREFVDGVEGATVLAGRCLPYGEGITYWPLAEMVKTVGRHLGRRSDRGGVREAQGLLRGRGRRRPARARRRRARGARGRPLGTGDRVGGARVRREAGRDAAGGARLRGHPLGRGAAARAGRAPRRLGARRRCSCSASPAPSCSRCTPAGAAGGCARRRSSSRRSGDAESERARRGAAGRARRAARAGRPAGRARRRPRATRCSSRRRSGWCWSGRRGGVERIPDSLQALIARPHRPAAAGPSVAAPARRRDRARLLGGALEHLSPDVEDVGEALDDLLLRDFLLPEPRSSISGELAFRFKHVLIREVAYAGLSKAARADHHARFAGWLKERAGEELIEIRAYHLDHAVPLLAELDGAAPAELADEAAAALTQAGRRALVARGEPRRRKLLLRAVELEPTLERRYDAARAAWRLGDLPAVSTRWSVVATAAGRPATRQIEGKALTALAEARSTATPTLPRRRSSSSGARGARATRRRSAFEALCDRVARMAGWLGDGDENERWAKRGARGRARGRPQGPRGAGEHESWPTRVRPARARRGGAAARACARARRGERQHRRPRARRSASAAGSSS